MEETLEKQTDSLICVLQAEAPWDRFGSYVIRPLPTSQAGRMTCALARSERSANLGPEWDSLILWWNVLTFLSSLDLVYLSMQLFWVCFIFPYTCLMDPCLLVAILIASLSQNNVQLISLHSFSKSYWSCIVPSYTLYWLHLSLIICMDLCSMWVRSKLYFYRLLLFIECVFAEIG